MSVIASVEFERCPLKWGNTQVKLPKGEAAVEIVSAWEVSERLTLGQVKAPDG